MMTIWPRRLALVMAPAYGESFASWVDRMALRNGCPPWTMAEALGLDVRASRDVRSLAYGIIATPKTYRALSFAGTLLDALRYFMDQRRYDPWAGTLWHEFCDDNHPTAVTNRVLNHLKIRNVDPALLKPLALWEPGAPYHLHPPATVEDLDLPEAALLLAGEGLGPVQKTV
ncbi:hypothetical protein ACTWPT_29625 [Nonomuraea sp. 3N208]|uniref:hypothetical protein n=1 Tax=Nonomuraea sp. 3N208 TaxID=3457421 RepID=UPI003FD426CB